MATFEEVYEEWYYDKNELKMSFKDLAKKYHLDKLESDIFKFMYKKCEGCYKGNCKLIDREFKMLKKICMINEQSDNEFLCDRIYKIYASGMKIDET